ncbi:MAG TPA: response regulator transcription factor [Gammaproteobacteria bacterium]|nr:response regulator transcription factor [Gammaproteobacteria bacterium]
MQSILIVEDHKETREWWMKNISSAFPDAVPESAVTLREAREKCASKHFLLALVDINLPDGNGLDLVNELVLQQPETYIVMSTIFDDDHHVFSALRAGANGYLIKDQPRDSQIEMLRDIVNGQPPISPGVARRILRYFSEQKVEQKLATQQLTGREQEVLRLIAKGYSRPEVADLMGLTANTVSSYTKVIYQKLNVSRRAEAVIEAIRLGLISGD